MIQAILFDVDGVLVHPGRWRAVLERDHGITPAMTAPFFRGRFVECLAGRAELLDELPPFLAAWHWTGSPAEFVDQWLHVENAPDLEVFDVVAEVRRQGLPCYAASSQERHRARYLRTAMGFERLLDGVFFSCDIGWAKPHARYFEAVERRVGRAGHELLFFDDAPENVDAARAAGWIAEHVDSAERLRSHLLRHTGLDIEGPSGTR